MDVPMQILPDTLPERILTSKSIRIFVVDLIDMSATRAVKDNVAWRFFRYNVAHCKNSLFLVFKDNNFGFH